MKRHPLRRRRFVKKFGKFFGHRAAEFLGVDDRHGAAIVARHVMADADRDEFDRRARLDLLDDVGANAFRDNCRD